MESVSCLPNAIPVNFTVLLDISSTVNVETSPTAVSAFKHLPFIVVELGVVKETIFALSFMMVFNSCGVKSGFAESIKAATPAT